MYMSLPQCFQSWQRCSYDGNFNWAFYGNFRSKTYEVSLLFFQNVSRDMGPWFVRHIREHYDPAKATQATKELNILFILFPNRQHTRDEMITIIEHKNQRPEMAKEMATLKQDLTSRRQIVFFFQIRIKPSHMPVRKSQLPKHTHRQIVWSYIKSCGRLYKTTWML